LNSAENRLRVLMVVRPLHQRIHLSRLSQEVGPPLSALAVLRLMIRSILVGCSTARSAGLQWASKIRSPGWCAKPLTTEFLKVCTGAANRGLGGVPLSIKKCLKHQVDIAGPWGRTEMMREL